MRSRVPLICFFTVVCAASAAAAPAKPVYRVDGATAIIKHHRLIVRAQGAVRTGGWATPRLRLRESSASESRALEVEFVAVPPRRGSAVAQATLPVHAMLAARLPGDNVAQVTIVSETNSMTVPITP